MNGRGNPNVQAARHLSWVGKEEKGASGEGWIEDIHASASKNFLSDENAEDDAESDHPQRYGGWKDQREEHGRDEEAFIDLVLSDDREDSFY